MRVSTVYLGISAFLKGGKNLTKYNCNDHIKLSKNERILMMIQLKSLENLTSHVAHY